MPWVAVSQSHGALELDLTVSAFDAALKVYLQALESGWEKYLVGIPVCPVFRARN